MKEKLESKLKKKRHNEVTFKPYVQNQGWLLPPSLEELIPESHLVRLVNSAIDGMDLSPVLNTYEGGGSSSYHPRMMLKALVYGYVEKIYSSRGIEKAIRENICLALSGSAARLLPTWVRPMIPVIGFLISWARPAPSSA